MVLGCEVRPSAGLGPDRPDFLFTVPKIGRDGTVYIQRNHTLKTPCTVYPTIWSIRSMDMALELGRPSRVRTRPCAPPITRRAPSSPYTPHPRLCWKCSSCSLSCHLPFRPLLHPLSRACGAAQRPRAPPTCLCLLRYLSHILQISYVDLPPRVDELISW